MKRVILKFASVKELWDFKAHLKTYAIDVNFKKNILTCECDQELIELAVNTYHAQLEEFQTS